MFCNETITGQECDPATFGKWDCYRWVTIYSFSKSKDYHRHNIAASYFQDTQYQHYLLFNPSSHLDIFFGVFGADLRSNFSKQVGARG